MYNPFLICIFSNIFQFYTSCSFSYVFLWSDHYNFDPLIRNEKFWFLNHVNMKVLVNQGSNVLLAIILFTVYVIIFHYDSDNLCRCCLLQLFATKLGKVCYNSIMKYFWFKYDCNNLTRKPVTLHKINSSSQSQIFLKYHFYEVFLI